MEVKRRLTSAASNGAATTVVRICLSTRLTIVVGSATSRARHTVPLKRTVADVFASR